MARRGQCGQPVEGMRDAEREMDLLRDVQALHNEGFRLNEVAQVDEHPTKVADDGRVLSSKPQLDADRTALLPELTGAEVVALPKAELAQHHLAPCGYRLGSRLAAG